MTQVHAEQKTEARVSGDTLVVSFMSAEPPRVWRADMGHVSTAVMELRDEGGACRLVVSKDGAEETVASFAGRSPATAALQEITRAMMDAPVTASAAPKTAARAYAAEEPKRRPFILRVLLGVIKVFLVIIAAIVGVVLLLSFIRPMFISSVMDSTEARSGVAVEQGVPLQADDFFIGR